MSQKEMQELIAKLKAENEQLKARSNATLRCKVSEKGAVSVIGIGKWPATFYKEQWMKLLAFGEEIKKFIAENDAVLSSKNQE